MSEMHPKLRLRIYEAIDKAINSSAEDDLWEGYIYPDLVTDMTDAAAMVFTASERAQRYAKQEDQ